MSDTSAIHPRLREILAAVIYPGFSQNIIALKAVAAARLHEDGEAVINMRPLLAAAAKQSQLEASIRQALAGQPDIKRVSLIWAPSAPASAADPSSLPGVKRVLAITSCKGGVGKSTLAVNLARALLSRGFKTGLLDLDIYGPSLAVMLGLAQAQIQADADGGLIPLETEDGLRALSVSFMAKSDQSLSWRGPMLNKMVDALLRKSRWQGLDILLLDLPPGAGEVQISLLRHIIMQGVIVISTPHPAALSDTVRGIHMFRSAPLLGIVENMSYYICPHCRQEHYLFGRDTVEPLARRLGLRFLGKIPFDPEYQNLTSRCQGPGGEAYAELAQKITGLMQLTPGAGPQ
jgi:ATP-binding protein involved in chromosome partitioning